MTQIVFLGDSHLGALKRATTSLPDPNFDDTLTFFPFGAGIHARSKFYDWDPSAQTLEITAPAWRKVAIDPKSYRADDGTPALVIVSLPLNTSRILRDVSWHTHVPWRFWKAETEQRLSDQAVERLLAEDYQHAVDFVLTLRDLGQSVAVLEAPRFFEDSPYLNRVRLDICQFVDDAYRREVRAQLDAAQIPVFSQPAHTITDLGTTDLTYRHENPADFHHANAKFGRVMLGSISEQMGLVAAAE